MAASQRQQQRYIHFKSCNGYIHFYIPFFYIFPPHIHLKNVLIPFPSRLHLQQTFIPPPKVNSSQLNNNFHIRTPPQNFIFSCSQCFCTIFVLISYSLYTQVMLILILIDVQYSQKAAFSFEKSLNRFE